MKNILVSLSFCWLAATSFAQPIGDSLFANLENELDTLITITAVGDMMLGTNFPSDKYLPPKGVDLLEEVKPYFKGQDLVFGNLEGAVLNEGGEVKKCSDPSKCYAFRQPEYVVDQIKDAGFNLLSVGNNHLGDFGPTGRENTLRILEEKGFTFAGQLQKAWDTVRVKGKLIGFIAFSPNSNCLRIDNLKQAKQLVQELDTLADIVIVSFHGGAEGAKFQHVTKKTERFYGENRGNVHLFARTVIDAGADLVLGHGPHVTRAIDTYKGKFITYSMGNFCTYARFNLRGPNGLAPIYQLRMDKEGNFVSGKLISVHQEGEGGPKLDEQNRALKVVQNLTKSDLPESKIQIADDGSISIAQ
mgnify:CR=1 FL=1